MAPAEGLESRVDACADRLLAGTHVEGGDEELARRYAERTYCEPFAAKGWVYEDGALAIAAYEWMQAGYACDEAEAGQPARTVSCEELAAEERELDCDFLRHVRRSEVAAFVERFRRAHGEPRCEDGTRVGELGVP